MDHKITIIKVAACYFDSDRDLVIVVIAPQKASTTLSSCCGLGRGMLRGERFGVGAIRRPFCVLESLGRS
jgi:hypothetical protein